MMPDGDIDPGHHWLMSGNQVEDDTEILIRHNVWGCGPKFWAGT